MTFALLLARPLFVLQLVDEVLILVEELPVHLLLLLERLRQFFYFFVLLLQPTILLELFNPSLVALLVLLPQLNVLQLCFTQPLDRGLLTFKMQGIFEDLDPILHLLHL